MRSRLTTLCALVIALLLGSATPAFAWWNGGLGGNGFGTHDWVINEAARLAGNPDWLNKSVAFLASDDPDTVYLDWRYHAYDEWGNCGGEAPQKAASLFASVGKAYRAGDFRTASKRLGLLSHYYSDVCNPLHTESSDPVERLMHSAYEYSAGLRTNRLGENRAWIVSDGFQPVSDIASRTVAAARRAHPRYSRLILDYHTYGYNAWVAKTTRVALNRAVNDLADIIMSIPSAPSAVATPAALPHGVIAWSAAWRHVGETVTVQGLVVQTKYAKESAKQPTYLNVGAPSPNPQRFAVLIPGQSRGNFLASPETYYFGHTIRMTGRIKLSSGVPQIAVTSPSGIEVVR